MRELTPLGIRLIAAADDARLIAAVARACVGWEGTPDPDGPVLRLMLRRDDSLDPGGEARIVVAGGRLSIAGGGIRGTADADAGRAECVLAPHWIEEEGRLVAEVLDPLILFLLTRSGRAPVHAAGFVAADLAVLLAGPSGSGKSCLALAAQRAGFALLSDDTVYVQHRPRLRVWGMPRPIHVFADDAPDARGPIRLRGGKRKRPVVIARPAPPANRAALCLLRPGAEVALQRIGPEAVSAGIGPLEPGFDLLAGEIAAALAVLAREGAWRLTLSRDPDAAIALLAGTVDRLGAAAVA